MSSGASPSPSPAAGWYPDPLDPASERLWDGEQWTEQTRPVGPTSMPPAPLRRAPASNPSSVATGSDRRASGHGWSTGSIVGIGCGLLALLSVGGCVVLVGVVPLMAVRSQEVFVEEGEIAVAIEEPTTIFAPEPMEEFPPTTAGPGVALLGSSVEMVAVLGSGEAAAFEVTVEEPVDVTEPVLVAGGPGLEPGGEDRVLVGVAATIVLRESMGETLSEPGLFGWLIVGGATGTSYPPVVGSAAGCDLIDADLAAVEEFSIGEEQRGTVCFPVPAEDFEHPETHLLLEVFGGAPITWTR